MVLHLDCDARPLPAPQVASSRLGSGTGGWHSLARYRLVVLQTNPRNNAKKNDVIQHRHGKPHTRSGQCFANERTASIARKRAQSSSLLLDFAGFSSSVSALISVWLEVRFLPAHRRLKTYRA
jgi:hypothetical protein